MDKTIAGVLGAVGTLIAAAPVQAGPAHAALEAASYADLLRPIPNARETLRALDETGEPQARFQEAQIVLPGVVIERGHHHHHHRYYRRPYRRYGHHHHHHHHHGYYR